MAVPKLKVYRLDQNYKETNDDDIRSLTNDELLPVITKDLNVFNTEEMVGIKERRDSRLVVESDWKTIKIPFDLSKDISFPVTMPVCCEGWVMGKGNMQVYIQTLNSDGTNVDGNGIPDTNILEDESNQFHFIPRKYWDYEVTSVKKYGKYLNISEFVYDEIEEKWKYEDEDVWVNGIYYENFIIYKETDSQLSETYYLEYDQISKRPQSKVARISEHHQKDQIVFKIGQWLIKQKYNLSGENSSGGNTQYKNFIQISEEEEGESSYENDCKNYIYVRFKKYQEFGSFAMNLSTMINYNEILNMPDEEINLINKPSRFRVPFGNIYNGNKEGRCLPYIDKSNNINYGYDLPDDTLIVNNEMKYYEGNYLYKRKNLPLRYKVAQSNNCYSEFHADEEIIDGSAYFIADKNWHMDGLLKPVLMERILIDIGTEDERQIFKPLDESQVNFNFSYKYDENNHEQVGYQMTFNKNYYLAQNNNYCYPREVFLFYNLTSDFSENIFDFDYDYYNYHTFYNVSIANDPESYNEMFKCGYANRGYLYANNDNSLYFNSVTENEENYLPYYQKVTKLAVLNNYGYDRNKDFELVLLNDENEIQQESIYGLESSIQNSSNSLNLFRFQIDDTLFADEMNVRIYIDGNKIWERQAHSPEDYYISSSENYTVYPHQNKKTFYIQNNLNDDLIKDLMVVYYRKHKMKSYALNEKHIFSENSNSNPVFLGYRIPCYEKVKTSNLFVSSFPNWVKGHLNNDLDIFVGNTIYSGVDTSVNESTGIYPCYKKDGWYPLYSEGAVQFNESITQNDYFDIYNYGSNYNVSSEILYKDFSDAPTIPDYRNNASNLKLYYNKVRYNVAHYDGIYTVMRGILSNYTIQNNGFYYALLEDDDFADSIGKKWLFRNDNYIRLIFESEQKELPEILSSNLNQKEDASHFKEYQVSGINKYFLRVGTHDNRIKMLSYKPSYNEGEGLIICLNKSNSQDFKLVGNDDILQDSDVRIHIEVERKTYTLCIGVETEQLALTNSLRNNLDQLFQMPVIDGETISNGINNYVSVDWCKLPDTDCIYKGVSIDEIQNNVLTVGNEISQLERESVYNQSGIMRYKYSNENWDYDVYFEVFSYRYKQSSYNGKNSPVDSVEIAIYRILKDKE